MCKPAAVVGVENDRSSTVSAVCEVCHKRPHSGRSVSRLGKNAIKRIVQKRAPRQFRPNVQRVRAVVDGTPRRITICTSCMKAGKFTRPSA